MNYLKPLREFMKNLYHFLEKAIFLFGIKKSKAHFILGSNLHEFIKFFLIFSLVLTDLSYYEIINHFCF